MAITKKPKDNKGWQDVEKRRLFYIVGVKAIMENSKDISQLYFYILATNNLGN
jgi:hypothetical protein